MNKEQFLAALREALSGMAPEDLQDAMRYYEEYFAEAGPEREAEVIEELGSPQKLAAQLRVDITMRRMEQSPPTARKGLSAVWIILLAIIAAPIAFPILIAILVLAFALLVSLAAVVFSLFIVVAALFGAGIVTAIFSFTLFFDNFFAGIAVLGAGFAITGGSLLVAVIMVLCARWGFHAIAKLLNYIRQRKGGKTI